MTTQYTSGHRSSGTLIAVLFSLLIGAVALAVFLRHATGGVLARVATAITGRTTTFDTSVPAVVQRIQRLNRLETVVYSIDTVVEGAKSSPVLPDLLAGDRILLVVHGQSIAGIDLSQLKPEDVRIDGQSINIPSPPPNCSPPPSTTSPPASPCVPPASSSQPIQISKPIPAPRPSSRSSRPHSPMESSTPPAKMPAPPSPPCSTASASTRSTSANRTLSHRTLSSERS